MAQQVVWHDPESPQHRHGGILLDNGNMICACCGSVFAASGRDREWSVVKAFENWVNIEHEMCGDDLYAEEPESAPEDTTTTGVSAEEFDAVYN